MNDYHAIPIEDVASDQAALDKISAFDIYIQVTAVKYLKLSNAGDGLSKPRLDAYRAKGTTHLFLTAQDYLRFSAQSPDPNAQPAAAQAAELRKEGEASLAILFSNQVDGFVLELANTLMDNVLSVVTTTPNMLELLVGMRREDKTGELLYKHAMSVSMLSVMLAHAMGWSSSEELHKIGMAGVFHDIGKKDLEKSLLWNKHLPRAKEEELKREHTQKGADLLAASGDVPTDVIEAVRNHHENCVGSGPGKLKPSAISVMAKIIAVADEFCKLTIDDPNGPRMDVESAVSDISLAEEFDTEVSKALVRLFKH